MMRQKVAAVVFLYNYDMTNIENINTYARQVDVVYAFDNTEIKDKNYYIEQKLKSISNLIFINGKGNQGLAVAINRVARLCVKKGYEWLITFDQDSQAIGNMVICMREFAEKINERKDIGIISPQLKKSELKYAKPIYEYSYIEWVFQSGAMHNLNVWKQVKGYDEKIFIDALDAEYCYRLMNRGFKIVRLNNAVLSHNVNDEYVEFRYMHGKKYYINKFSPVRYYYIVRNNLYCIKHYGKDNVLFHAEAKNSLKTMFKTWTLEKEKKKRAKAIFLGILDFLLGRMGKIRWKI